MANVDEIRQQIAAAEARIARLKNEVNKRAKAEDTRRRILLGSFVLAATKTNTTNLSRLGELFKMNGHAFGEYLTKPSDRRLFDLAALPSPEPSENNQRDQQRELP